MYIRIIFNGKELRTNVFFMRILAHTQAAAKQLCYFRVADACSSCLPVAARASLETASYREGRWRCVPCVSLGGSRLLGVLSTKRQRLLRCASPCRCSAKHQDASDSVAAEFVIVYTMAHRVRALQPGFRSGRAHGSARRPCWRLGQHADGFDPARRTLKPAQTPTRAEGNVAVCI